MNPAAHPSPIMSFLPIFAIFGIFYFLIIRPQQQQAKEHEKMLAALKKGDRVLLNGGIYGVITALKGPELELRIADNVKVSVARSAVAKVASSSAPVEAEVAA